MFCIEEFIIAVFCCVDDELSGLTQGRPIQAKGFAPALSDSEVLTMEIVAEYQGIDADQAIWQYFRHPWLQRLQPLYHVALLPLWARDQRDRRLLRLTKFDPHFHFDYEHSSAK